MWRHTHTPLYSPGFFMHCLCVAGVTPYLAVRSGVWCVCMDRYEHLMVHEMTAPSWTLSHIVTYCMSIKDSFPRISHQRESCTQVYTVYTLPRQHMCWLWELLGFSVCSILYSEASPWCTVLCACSLTSVTLMHALELQPAMCKWGGVYSVRVSGH